LAGATKQEGATVEGDSNVNDAAKGWDITAFRPNKKSTPYGRYFVAIADRDAAVRAIRAWFPDAKVVVNSETLPDSLAACSLKDGKIVELR
jgi:hypothetical protein